MPPSSGSCLQGGRVSPPMSALRMVLVCQGCCYKVPQTRWLQTMKSFSLTVWRLEVRNQRVSIAVFSRCRFSGETLFHAFLLASGVAGSSWWVDTPLSPQSLPLLSHGHLLPVCPCLCLFSEYGHNHRYWGLGLQHIFFWGTVPPATGTKER